MQPHTEQFLPAATLANILAFFVAIYVLSSIRAWWRLRAFHSPLSASFSYLWVLRAATSGRMNEIIKPIVEKHGTTRIGPNELVTADPEVIRRIGSARSPYTRSNWYALNRLIPGEDSMFSTLDVAQHDWLKAKTAPGYAGRDIPGIEGVVDSVLDELISKIRTKYANNPSETASSPDQKPLLDLAKITLYFTLDSITKISFGRHFGFVSSDSDVYGHLTMIDEMAPAAMAASSAPYIGYIATHPWVARLAMTSMQTKGVFRILPITRSIIANRFNPSTPHTDDMLGSFIKNGLSERQCNNEAILQVIAGSDTTATGIRATMLFLMTNPRVYSTLQREIDEAIREGKISTPVKNAEALELKYLQAVIWEGLRVHPPFNGLTFKLVPPGGDTIDGKFVPGGTKIAPLVEGFTRSKRVFGEDAEVFRPERWIADGSKDGEERVAEMRKVVELIFGYGRYGCAGKMLGFFTMRKVFVEVCHAATSLFLWFVS